MTTAVRNNNRLLKTSFDHSFSKPHQRVQLLDQPVDLSKDEQNIRLISNLQANLAKVPDDSKKDQKGLKLQMHATKTDFSRKERLNQTEYID